MSITYWIMSGLTVTAGGLCLWAYLTSGPGPDWRHDQVRQRPAHDRRARGATTQRLNPRPPEWLPPADRPGGERPWPPQK